MSEPIVTVSAMDTKPFHDAVKRAKRQRKKRKADKAEFRKALAEAKARDARVKANVQRKKWPRLHGRQLLGWIGQRYQKLFAWRLKTHPSLGDGTIFTSSEREGKRQRSGKSVAVVPRRPGRNESCPCGSGHKYKRCCAA